MSRSIFYMTQTFVENAVKHLARAVSRGESVGEAASGIRRDARKLRRAFASSRGDKGDRREAASKVEEGRQHYNQKRYERAEEAFRDAILSDPSYGLAYTYLGHTLYKTGRTNEAVLYWQQALDKDPGSDGARKASRKLRMMDEKKKAVKEWIDDRQP